MRDLLASLNPFVRPAIGSNFVTDLSAPIEAWQEEARNHPVFIFTPS